MTPDQLAQLRIVARLDRARRRWLQLATPLQAADWAEVTRLLDELLEATGQARALARERRGSKTA